MATRRRARAAWGKVRKLPSGRYQASYVAPDGERHAAPMTFGAKVDADAWLATQRVLIVSGKWTPATASATHTAQAERSQSLGEYAEGWLTTRTNSRGDSLRPRTQDEYRRLLARPLAPLTPSPLVPSPRPRCARGEPSSWQRAARRRQVAHTGC